VSDTVFEPYEWLAVIGYPFSWYMVKIYNISFAYASSGDFKGLVLRLINCWDRGVELR
jgi:hypothetical protein